MIEGEKLKLNIINVEHYSKESNSSSKDSSENDIDLDELSPKKFQFPEGEVDEADKSIFKF